jgi:hypothetical protein
MALSITHSTVVATPDDGTSDVGSDEWNAAHSIAGLGTGVETALGVNVGSAGAVVLNGGALGTPSSGTLTNCTGLPQAGTVGLTTADNPQFAGVNLSHASDNTLTGSGGNAFIEGTVLIKGGSHTIWIPAGAMITATTSGAASASLETGTNDVNYKVFDFDASADEHVHFSIAMPKGWDEGTVTYQVFWSSTATDTDGVAWGLQAVAVSDNEAIDASWGTAVVVTDDCQGAAGETYVTSVSSAVTIGGSPAEGDIVFFRLFRDVSDANDDATEDARLIGVKLFYTVSSANDA